MRDFPRKPDSLEYYTGVLSVSLRGKVVIPRENCPDDDYPAMGLVKRNHPGKGGLF